MLYQAKKGATTEHRNKTIQQADFRIQETWNSFSYRQTILPKHISEFYCDKYREATVFSEEI